MTPKRVGKLVRTVAVVMVGLFFCSPVRGGSTNDWLFHLSLDELMQLDVGTVRKREERVQDIPGSVLLLERNELEDVGPLRDIRDFMDLVPGFMVNDTQLATVTEPTIRGAGIGRNRMSVSAVGLYRNGAYFSTGGLGGKNFSRMDYYDLERAEVLRGPQGALYGRNAMGGSINLISRKPTSTVEAEITARYGELDLFGGELLVNVPLSDHVALRVSRVEEHREDGFYSNINGEPVDDLSYSHTRLSLRYQPGGGVDINYVFDRQDENSPPTVRVRPSLVPGLGGDEFNTYVNTKHETTHDVKNHGLTIDVPLERGVLSSVSNYRERRSAMLQDGDFFGRTAALAQRQRVFLQEADVSDVIFQELRYAANGTECLK